MLLFTPALLGAQQPQAADTEPWTIVPMAQASLVLARDGSLIGEIGKEIRTSVSIKTLPRYLGQAFVAVEDHRFYQHDGVDVVGIAGALKDNIFGERRGASTITQQLVGNMHPTLIDRTDRSLGRKLAEQSAAREMEKHYSKDQILEAYLNQIPFGHGWYGVESAAQHYFGKSASKLSLAEAAALASMPKGPALYDPLKYPDRVQKRRNVVLSLMQDQGFITVAQATSAKAARLTTSANGGYSAYSPWFVNVVRVQALRAGIPVNQGGYRVYTSLDPILQNAATSALREGTAAVEAEPGYAHPKYVPGAARQPAQTTDYLQGMVVALDPTSGDVRALVGGRDYNDSQFDRAVDGMRQPGSSFKPIVYAAAIADSITANALFADTALAITLPNRTIYRPENSDSEFLGTMTLREALTMSRNVVAVEIAMKLGMDSIANLAARMGINSVIAPYPSSAIGASAVQPLDLVAAYTTFANLGTPCRRQEPESRAEARSSCARSSAGSAGYVRRARHDARRGRARHRDAGQGVCTRFDSGRGKDRNHKRQHRCVVHRTDAGPGRRRLAGVRQADFHGARRRRWILRGAGVGEDGQALLRREAGDTDVARFRAVGTAHRCDNG